MFTLEKNSFKDFIVLNLTDPQLNDREWQEKGETYRILRHTIETLIDRVHPDLITISGDLACAGQDFAYDSLADYLDSLSIPWAPVWGNHDNQDGAAYIDSVADRYLTHPLCLYEKGDPSLGNGNYVIAICEEGKIVSALIMMDSHDRVPREDNPDRNCWAKLTPLQIMWYQEQIAALNSLGCHDTTIITHIPIYAYRNASAAAYKAGIDPKSITLEMSVGTEV